MEEHDLGQVWEVNLGLKGVLYLFLIYIRSCSRSKILSFMSFKLVFMGVLRGEKLKMGVDRCCFIW